MSVLSRRVIPAARRACPRVRRLLGAFCLALLPFPVALADGFIYIPVPPPIIIHPPLPRPRPIRPHFPLEVTRHRVAAEIDETVARTRVEETFSNPNDTQLEGIYLFPLPAGAAVSNFAMKIGGREVTGEILEKGKAREIYESIVRQARDPGLLEYVDRGLFRASVFPIPARGAIEVVLEYSETLPRERGSATYRYPLDTGKYSAGEYRDVVVDVRLRSSIALRSIHCPSHEAAAVSRPGEREARVTFEAKQLRADKDFIVAWNVSEDALAPTLLAHRTLAGGDGEGLSGFFLFSVSPRAEAGRKPSTKDVVFLLDTSGSMLGEKMEQARKALRHGIAGLNPGDRFSIIDFSTEARRFRDGLVEANEENKRAASAHIDELKARGGTNIEEGLRLALSDLQSRDRLQMVVFLSDGEPTVGVTNPGDILRMVKDKNPEKRRVFVFGVGEDLNAKLLDAIARESRGASQYIRSQENLEVPVSNFFDKIDSPVLTDITLEFPGGGVADLYPRPLPDLFRGEQLEVFGRYGTDGQRTVVIRGKLYGEERVFEYSLPFTAASNPYLPRLWALRKVGYLLEQIRLSGETTEVKEEVIRLSKLYGIITPYTSYLILEEDRRLAQAGDRPHRFYREAARDALAERESRGADGLSAPAAAAPGEVRAEALARKRGFALDSGAEAVEASREVLALKTGSGGQLLDKFVDGTVNAGSERLKHAGDRTFYLQGSRWVDSALTEKDLTGVPDVRRVKYLSDEYFQLLAEDAAIGKLLAVGSEVTFLWLGKVIAVEA